MAKAERVVSVDLLRGLVMFAMIFVNCGFYRSPGWCMHFPSGGDGITFVDVIFPAFLFMAGVSVPLAFERYGAGLREKLLNVYHVLYRSATLMVMGIIYVNAEIYPDYLGGTGTLWLTAALAAVWMAWQRYGGDNRVGKWVSDGFKLLGGALLAGFFILCFIKSGGAIPRYSWGGILGLIGRAYLVASLIYLIIGKRPSLLMFAVLAMSMIHVASFGGGLTEWWWLSGGDRVSIMAGQSSVTMLGVVAGAKLLQVQGMETASRHRETLIFLVMFMLLCFITGTVLRRMYGIHKDSTFPAYVYITVGWTCVAWIVCYCVRDLFKVENFLTRFLTGVGTVALAAYVASSLLRGGTEMVPLFDGRSLYYWLFKSLPLAAESYGASLWFVQMVGAAQTLFFAWVVSYICLWLKKRRITLKI